MAARPCCSTQRCSEAIQPNYPFRHISCQCRGEGSVESQAVKIVDATHGRQKARKRASGVDRLRLGTSEPSDDLIEQVNASAVPLRDKRFRRFVSENQTMTRSVEQRRQIGGETLDLRSGDAECDSGFARWHWRWQKRERAQEGANRLPVRSLDLGQLDSPIDAFLDKAVQFHSRVG